MGCFSCFDSSDDETLNPAEESKAQKQSQPTVSNSLSGLPSGLLIIQSPILYGHTLSQDLILIRPNVVWSGHNNLVAVLGMF